MTIGINAYNEQEYEKFIQAMLDLPTEEEYPEAYDRDHEDFRPNGMLGHIYNADLIQPSGHEWVSSNQIVGQDKDGNYILRQEYYEGEIHARAESVSFDDDSIELASNEAICQWCHLTTLAQTKCVNCEEYVN
jgi:hypothetical protein